MSVAARLFLALLVVFAIATVAGCGGDSSGPDATGTGSAEADRNGDADDADGGAESFNGDPEEPIEEEPVANNDVLLGAQFFGEQPARFGDVALGATRKLGFTIKSLGVARRLQGVALAGDHAADFKLALGSCTIGAEIQLGGSCALTITFSPTADGVRKASLRIEIDPGVSGGRSLEGNGGSAPVAPPPPPTATIPGGQVDPDSGGARSGDAGQPGAGDPDATGGAAAP